jgi:hypothetical protein
VNAVLVLAAFVRVGRWVDPATGQPVVQTDTFAVGTGQSAPGSRHGS